MKVEKFVSEVQVQIEIILEFKDVIIFGEEI